MGSRDMLYCDNHPDRIALERCEVCHKPLCAYCLYYTQDGQRLCATHAEVARLQGTRIEEPGAYADQLIGAQAGADRKRKRSQSNDDENLYVGNSNDLMSFLGMLIGLISLGACCGAGYCLPVVAFVMSLVGLLNAKKAHDPARTRKYSVIGLVVSGLFVLVLVGCIALYAVSLGTFATAFQSSGNLFGTWGWFTETPTPSPSSTYTQTPASLEDTTNAAFSTPDPPPAQP